MHLPSAHPSLLRLQVLEYISKSEKSEVIEHKHDIEHKVVKVKKPKTRKFLNRGRSLEHFESSESELEDIYGRGIPPNKPPRRKNRNKNTSSGSDMDSSQPKLKGILKKQSSVESNDIKSKRLNMRRISLNMFMNHSLKWNLLFKTLYKRLVG